MKYKLLFTLLTLGMIVSCTTKKQVSNFNSETNKSKKALFICTSVGEVNGKKNGTFLSEIAIPFILLEEENFKIDLVSPKGGEIPIYYKFDTTEAINRALHSDYYREKIGNSLKPKKNKSERL